MRLTIEGLRRMIREIVRRVDDETMDRLRRHVPGIGDWVSSGNTGDIYELGHDRVIKVVRSGVLPRKVEQQRAAPDERIARVYGHGRIPGSDTGYWYTMERLRPLSLSAEQALDAYLTGESFEPPAGLEEFADWMLGLTGDWHAGNVMLTAAGVPKLIDLESF